MRDPDLEHRVLQGDDPSVLRVAAALREFLVLELDRLGAGGLVAAHGMLHVERAAETGIGIGDQRGRCALNDLAHPVDHVAVSGIAGVRHAEMRGGDAVAAHIQRLEAESVGHPGRDQIVDTRCCDEFIVA